MKTEDIKNIARAWQQVQEASKKNEASDTQMGTITVKTDAEREARAKAYRDKKAKNEELKGNQHKLDHNKNGKIDAADFKGLRKKAKNDQEVEIQTSEAKVDEGSIKGSGTDRKAQLKKAYRSGEQKTRDFYKGTITPAPKTKDKGIKKAFDKGTGSNDGSPAARGIDRVAPRDRLKNTEHGRSEPGPYGKTHYKTQTHASKMAAIKYAKKGKLPESTVDEGSIKGSGTDRKAQLKKAYRDGEQKTRDFYKGTITPAPKTRDKGIKKAFDKGTGSNDGSPAPRGIDRTTARDRLRNTEHGRSEPGPYGKTHYKTQTHASKMRAIKYAKKGKLPEATDYLWEGINIGKLHDLHAYHEKKAEAHAAAQKKHDSNSKMADHHSEQGYEHENAAEHLHNASKAYDKGDHKAVAKHLDMYHKTPVARQGIKEEAKMESVAWPIYRRLMEKDAHTKGATPPEEMDSKASGKEKEFRAKHKTDTVDNPEASGGDIAKATNAAPSKKARPGDNPQSDKMQKPVDTTK